MRISDWSSDVCSSDLEAEIGGHCRCGTACPCVKRLEPVNVAAEAQLPTLKRAAVKPAMAVEHRQQGQPDAAGLARGKNALCYLGRVGIGQATGLVVQIVELCRCGKSGQRHIHLHVRGYRLDIIGGEQLEKAVHDLDRKSTRLNSSH